MLLLLVTGAVTGRRCGSPVAPAQEQPAEAVDEDKPAPCR